MDIWKMDSWRIESFFYSEVAVKRTTRPVSIREFYFVLS